MAAFVAATTWVCLVARSTHAVARQGTGSARAGAGHAMAGSGRSLSQRDHGPGPRPGLLPAHRIVAFYGNPLSPRMGVLGVRPVEAMLDSLEWQAQAYARADTTHPVIAALQLVATVAQPAAGSDRMYRLRTPDSIIRQLAGLAESRGMLLFLDAQIGHSTVRDEVAHLLPYLEDESVHLALDPEFAMGSGGGAPGSRIGSLDATDVNAAIDMLVELVDRLDLPPKVLVVHRFMAGMLTCPDQIRSDARVQVVIDMDGFGNPALKRDSYRWCVPRDLPVFAGIKLFYQLDQPLLTVREVLGLEPVPLFVLYQ